MKFKAYNDKTTKKEIYFKLCETYNKNVISLVVTDKNGLQTNNILRISSDGLHLATGIDKFIGLPLDRQGCVKLNNND